MSSDNHREYPVIDGTTVHDPDDLNRVKRVIQAAKEDTEIFPHLNNFNPNTQSWDSGHRRTCSPTPASAPRCASRSSASSPPFPAYRGLSLDIENLPDEASPAYLELHSGALRRPACAQSAPLRQHCRLHHRRRPEADCRQLRRHHADELRRARDREPARPHRQPGVVRRQPAPRPENRPQGEADLRRRQLRLRLDALHSRSQRTARHPKPQVLNTEDLSVSEAWQRASDADADLDLDYDTLNPHFEYIDEDLNQRHVVWFLDGVTMLNELRAARALGLQTFALWRLGEEDSSLWSIWDKPSNPESLQALGSVQPGHDVDNEGDGDIIRVTGLPQPGKRTVEVDTDEPDPRKKLIVDEHMDVYPRTYTIEQYGYHANEVALSFDDGPDPKWTPKILDILREQGRQGNLHDDRRRGRRRTSAS